MISKLTITRCNVSNGKVSPSNEKFKATINPSDVKRNYSISYSDTDNDESAAIGKAGASPKFERINSQKLKFSIVLDGTGVVEAAEGKSVSDQVNALGAVVYDYQGNNHEPSVVEITWGSGMQPFQGRLTNLDIDYTLFKSTGEPLRAKVTLGFASFLSNREEALKANRQSPDLTHKVRVVAGDTLPLLCQRLYDDSSQYLFVARENGLTSFRTLEPGTVLSFPPLR